MISCLHDHFLDDQLLSTPHLYFLYLVRNLLSIMVGSSGATSGTSKGKEPSNRDLMNALKSIQRQLKTSGDS